jgi:hypothetical protein
VVLTRGRGLDGETRVIEAETRVLPPAEVAPGVEEGSEAPQIDP